MNALSRRKDTPAELGGERRIFNRLPVLRVERGLSRRELADALGINYQTVGYIERGDFNPSLDLAFRISDFFQLPIEAIFSRQPLPPLSEAVFRRSSEDPTHA